MNRYLITGGAGFVGSHLAEKLTQLGKEVMVYDNLSFGKEENISEFLYQIEFVQGDVTDFSLLEKTIKGFLPEVVIHLAAIHFIPYCNAHPREAFKVNIGGTHGLLDICARHKPKRLLFASSAAVYPPSDKPHHETDEVKPFDVYGATKICGETIMQLFAQQTQVSTVSCRLFNIYGPKETNDHVIPHIMGQLKSNGATIKLGNITPKRDYIYVNDIIDALFAILKADTGRYETFNVGTGKEYSVQELVEKISAITARDIAINSIDTLKRKVERPHLCADISKIKQKIGWSPQYDINQGLSELINVELKDTIYVT